MSDSADGAEAMKEDERLDARAAQERIAAAFHGGERDEDGVPGGGGEVHSLNGGPVPEMPENPFATDAAIAETVRQVEALLFASPQPLKLDTINRHVPSASRVHLERLEQIYRTRGVHLREVGGAWQFVTAPDLAHVLVEQRSETRKLSRAALETLAIIAYHQPCSRADIEEVRGVAVAKGSLDQLMELGWIALRGRRDAPGKPVLYGTTPAFLEHFGLASVTDLPGLSDLKAAGLLDARLPPGFSVPRPADADDDGGEGPADALTDGEERDFAVDYGASLPEDGDEPER